MGEAHKARGGRVSALDALKPGTIRLAVLVAAIASGIVLAAAECFGWGGLCISEMAVIAFLAFIAAAEAGLIALFFASNREIPLGTIEKMVAAEGILCAAMLVCFPVASQSSVFLLFFAALPGALYLPFPRNLAWSAVSVSAIAAIRLFVLRPEALGQGAASFADAFTMILLPLLIAAPLSIVSATLAESSRLQESILGVTRLNLSYQDYAANLEERSALDERLRLTRDIHDVVGMALTNAIMMARAAKIMYATEPEKLPAILESAETNADRALLEVRSFLHELRAREVRRAAGPVAIARVARMFRLATSVDVDVDYGNFEWDLGDEESFIINHFVQEGMLNAYRHGKARSIRVSFRRSEEGLRVTVRDDGKGAKDPVEGIGISGIRERVAAAGGSLEYGSAGDGFRISILLPGRSA
ncbi:MAG: sensor histidine kinase [Spirochaetaceae bacterium]|nr:sensor histidine kinase [Spirochaetaceae bacterium]